MAQIVTGADGTVHEFPDEATPDMIAKALGVSLAAPPTSGTGIDVKLGASEQPAISNYQPTPAEFAADDAAIAARNGEPTPEELAAASKPYFGRPQQIRQGPTPTGDKARAVADNLARSVASGATFGLADELAAGANTLAGDKSYSENLANERARDASIPGYLKIPGEIAGGLATGLGAGRAGLTLMNAAAPTVANMALRGAGEGAAYGAAHGFGRGEGTQDRLEQAAYGGALGALTGGATGAVAGRMANSGSRAAVPTTDALKAQSKAAYDTARSAGLVVQPQSYDGLVGKIAGSAKLEGLDPTLHPNTTAAIKRLVDAQGKPQTLQEIDTLRQVLSDAKNASPPKSGDARLASRMIDKLDDFVENLKPSDVAAGDASKAVPALNEARDLWSRFRKSETIDSLLQRAQDRATQFSGSGLENAIRTEFRGLLMNPKRLRGFSPDEVAAIRKVAKGGPVENALRMLGKLAPTGVVSQALGGGMGYAVGGPVGAVALPAAGFGARQAATAMTRGNVNKLSDLVRSGGALPGPGTLTPGQRALIQGLLIGQAEEGPRAIDGLRGLLSPMPVSTGR